MRSDECTGTQPRLGRRRLAFIQSEFLVAVVVISVLARVATPAFTSGVAAARRAVLVATLREMQTAVDVFRNTAGRAPSREQTKGVCVLLDFLCDDGFGGRFVTTYLTSEPDGRPPTYGLKPADGPIVYFGLTPDWRVFATQEPPSGTSWSAEPDMLFGASSTGNPPPVDRGGAQPPAAPVVAVISVVLTASKSQADTGELVTATATPVTLSGDPAVGVDLEFTILGSVSGTRVMQSKTGADGACRIQFTSVEAEITVVTARVLRS